MKPHLLKGSMTLFLMGLLIATWVVPIFAQDSPTQITIRVDGLSCPFCAYGLEKRLKRLDGAEKVQIDIDQGMAKITVSQGKTIDENQLKKAVLDAGFTPKEIHYSPLKP
jgi:mercuric ion binding protein